MGYYDITYSFVPGKSCKRTATSFYQDVDYLKSVGETLTTSQGLCNVGEWHSHHRINLPKPSSGDEITVWKHMGSGTGGRFLLFIATITGPEEKPRVNIGCFMFSLETRTITEGLLVALQGSSPIRGQFNDVSFTPGPEQKVSWSDFVETAENSRAKLKEAKPHEENKATKKKHGYKKTGESTKLLSDRPSRSYNSINPFQKSRNSDRPMRDIASPTSEIDEDALSRRKKLSIFCCC